MSDKKSFVLYDSWGVLLQALPKEQAGEIVQAMCAYVFGDIEPEIENPTLAAIFQMIKGKMDEDGEKWNEKREKLARNGKKGGEAQKSKCLEQEANASEKKQMLQDESKCLEREANASEKKQMLQDESKCLEQEANASEKKQIGGVYVSVSVNDNVSVSKGQEESIFSPVEVIDNNIHSVGENIDSLFPDGERAGECAPGESKLEKKWAIEAWNDLKAVGVQPISTLTEGSQRLKMLRARLREHGKDAYIKALANIRASPFLQGKNNRGWMVTFDWFVKPSNFVKVLEGNYNQRNNGENEIANELEAWKNDY